MTTAPLKFGNAQQNLVGKKISGRACITEMMTNFFANYTKICLVRPGPNCRFSALAIPTIRWFHDNEMPIILKFNTKKLDNFFSDESFFKPLFIAARLKPVITFGKTVRSVFWGCHATLFQRCVISLNKLDED